MKQKNSQTKKANSVFSTTRTTSNIARLAWIFIIASGLLTALIVYITSIQTKIIFTRENYAVQATFASTITPNPTDDTSIQGTYETKTIEYTYTESNLESTKEISGYAEGDITVTNNWTQNQPLQATTRFLSADGVLFRSTERIDVPAGGTAIVHVIADQKGSTGDIESGTRFSIPGLWQGLQEQIFGTNEQAFSGGTKSVAVITEENITNAREKALLGLDEKATNEMNNTGENTETYVLRSELLVSQANVSAGTEADAISYATRARYIAVHIPSQELYDLLYEKLGLILTEDEEITSINLGSVDMTVESVAVATTSAQIRIHVQGLARLKDTASVFSPVTLSGKTKEDLQSIAEAEQGIASINVSFAPFWATKTPSNGKHMSITIN